MSINYEDFDEFDSDSSLDSFINIIEDQDGGTIVFNSSELMSANFDGGIPKTVIKTSIEAATNPLGVGDYIFWTSGTTFPDVTISNDDVDGELDESDNPADYMDVYLVTGIESNDDDSVTPTYDIAIMLEDDEYIISGVGGSTQICAIKEDWDSKELGTTGWLITSSGNAIFTNIAARGRIEATSGYLQSLDVNGVLRVKGTVAPTDPDGTEDQIIASLKVYQNDLYTAKEQGSVVVNKNGLIIRSKDPNTLQEGVNAEIIAKFPINGGAPKISGYTNDDGNPDDGNNPPVANESQIVIGGQKNNITINGGKGNKAIYTTINNNRTVFASPGSGETLTGFLIQLIDTDSGPGETWNTRMRLSGVNGSLTFDGSDLTVTGAINATSGVFTNTVTVGNNATNTIKIDGTAFSTTTAIHSSSSTGYGIGGFWLDASGRFSLGTLNSAQSLSWDGSNLAIRGTITAGNPATNAVVMSAAGLTGTRAGIPMFNLPTDGSEPTIAGFKITQTGLITVGEITGRTITGTSGNTFVTVSSTTDLFIGMLVDATGVQSGTVITGISGSRLDLSQSITQTFTNRTVTFRPNANLIIGTNLNNNITLRGQTAGAIQPAIYTVINGSATTSTSGNGFYIGQDGQFRLATTDPTTTLPSSVQIKSGNLEITGDLYSRTAVIGGTYALKDRMYVVRDKYQISQGVATNDSVTSDYGQTMTVTLYSGTVSNSNYVWLGSVTQGGKLKLIGRVSSLSQNGNNLTFSLTSPGVTFTVLEPNWTIGSDIRFTSTLTSSTVEDDNMIYSGFGNTNDNLFYVGGTTNTGSSSGFRIQHTGTTLLVKSSAIRNRTLAVAGSPVYVAGAGNEFELGLTGSSIRFKKDISDAYNEILNSNFLDLNPVKFKYKEAGDNSEFVYGFIAEQAEELGLDFLYQVDEEGVPDWFGYDRMPVYLFTLVKYQHQKIQELEERLAILEG